MFPEVDPIPDRSSSPTWGFHPAYAYLTGLLTALMGVKFQGGNNPFKEHSAIMILFLIAMSVYVVALMVISREGNLKYPSPYLWGCLCHVSGALACELLVLILVSPPWWFFINVSSLLVIVASIFCYRHVSVVSMMLKHLKDRMWFGETISDIETQSTEGQAAPGAGDIEASVASA